MDVVEPMVHAYLGVDPLAGGMNGTAEMDANICSFCKDVGSETLGDYPTVSTVKMGHSFNQVSLSSPLMSCLLPCDRWFVSRIFCV